MSTMKYLLFKCVGWRSTFIYIHIIANMLFGTLIPVYLRLNFKASPHGQGLLNRMHSVQYTRLSDHLTWQLKPLVTDWSLGSNQCIDSACQFRMHFWARLWPWTWCQWFWQLIHQQWLQDQKNLLTTLVFTLGELRVAVFLVSVIDRECYWILHCLGKNFNNQIIAIQVWRMSQYTVLIDWTPWYCPLRSMWQSTRTLFHLKG